MLVRFAPMDPQKPNFTSEPRESVKEESFIAPLHCLLDD